MLNKTILIALDKLKPNTITEGLILKEIIDYLISSCIISTYYTHLNISYNYNRYISVNELVTNTEKYLDEDELFKVNMLLSKFIEECIEEFNIYSKNKVNTVLNINSCLINKNNLLLSTEVLVMEV